MEIEQKENVKIELKLEEERINKELQEKIESKERENEERKIKIEKIKEQLRELNGDDHYERKRSYQSNERKYRTRKRNRRVKMQYEREVPIFKKKDFDFPPKRELPTIKLKKKKKKTKKEKIPDYDNMSITERAKYRSEFAIKLQELKTKWTKYKIPDYSSDDLKIQHAEYYSMCNQLLRVVTNSQYKSFLILIWLGVELIGTKIIKVDISDFTNIQRNNFEMYDHLINEVSKNGSFSIGKGLSPFIQILLLTGLNIFITILIKWISRIGGSGVVGVVNNLISGTLSPSEVEKVESPIKSPPKPPGNMIETVASNFSNVANFFTKIPTSSTSANGDQNESTKKHTRGPRFQD